MAIGEVLSLARGKEVKESIDSAEASEILRRNINNFLQRKGDRLGVELIDYDESKEGLLTDGVGRKLFTMDKEELKNVMRAVMAEFEVVEERKKPQRRTEVDLKTYKLIPTSYTEYRMFRKPNSELSFKWVEVFEGGKVKKGWISIAEVHKGQIVKSSLPPKRSN